MLQASLKIFSCLSFSAFSRFFFGNHAQVGSRIEVDGSNIKHHGGPLLLEAMDTYVIPQLCRCHYLSWPSPQLSCSVLYTPLSPSPLVLSVNVRVIVGCLPLP